MSGRSSFWPLTLFFLIGCGDSTTASSADSGAGESAVGQIGGPCFPDQTCREELPCVASRCVATHDGGVGDGPLRTDRGGADAQSPSKDGGSAKVDAKKTDSAPTKPDGPIPDGPAPDGLIFVTDGPKLHDGSGQDSDGPAADSATADDGSNILTCKQQGWNTTYSGENLFFFIAGRIYSFSQNSSQWLVADASGATMVNIPLPAALLPANFYSARMSPSGKVLIHLASGGQQYGVFFDGTTFGAATPIPNSISIRGDGQENVYFHDSWGIWKSGATPTTLAAYSTSPYGSDWAVGVSGKVYVVKGSTTGTLTVQVVYGGPGGANVCPGCKVKVTDPHLAAGRDGSIHVTWRGVTTSGAYAYYSRSADGIGWSAYEMMREPMPLTAIGSTQYISPAVIDFLAMDFNAAQVLVSHNGGSFYGNYLFYLKRCGGSWVAAGLGTPSYSIPYPAMTTDETGLPAIRNGGTITYGY